MTIKTLLKVLFTIFITAVVACVTVFAWLKLAPRHVPQGQPPLATLGGETLPAFRDTFNAGNGEVRILTMLSPT